MLVIDEAMLNDPSGNTMRDCLQTLLASRYAVGGFVKPTELCYRRTVSAGHRSGEQLNQSHSVNNPLTPKRPLASIMHHIFKV